MVPHNLVLRCHGLLRDNPFTGSLPVLPQYNTAQYSPLGHPDCLRQLKTESDWVRQLQIASRPLYRLFPALYRPFFTCTAFSTVLSFVSGMYFRQYSTSWTISLVPGTYRTLYLVSAPLYCLQYSTTGIFSCIRVLQDSPPDMALIWSSWSPFIKIDEDCPLI